MRARGQLTELRERDLRFTAEETAELVGKVMGLELPAGSLAALAADVVVAIGAWRLVLLSGRGEHVHTGLGGFPWFHFWVMLCAGSRAYR